MIGIMFIADFSVFLSDILDKSLRDSFSRHISFFNFHFLSLYIVMVTTCHKYKESLFGINRSK